jgi:hypothetical protein
MKFLILAAAGAAYVFAPSFTLITAAVSCIALGALIVRES